MDNQAAENTLPQKKRRLPLPIILTGFIPLILSISILLFLPKEKTSTVSSPSTQQESQTISLPKHDLVIYTKCFGGTYQPSNCILYRSDLKTQEVKEAYTFTFPKVQQSPSESNFTIEVHGVIDKKVIYTKRYSEKQVAKVIMGYIDLMTGKNTEFYHRGDKLLPGEILNTYLDHPNKRIYVAMEDSPENGERIGQYDISTNKLTVVANPTTLKASYIVLAATKDILLLSYVERVGSSFAWSSTYDLTKRQLTKNKIQISSAVFDKDVTRMAYIEQKTVNNYFTSSISLKVSDLDGSHEKIIYTIPNTRLPADGYDGSFPYSYISNLNFNEDGDRLSFDVAKSKPEGNRYDGEITTHYFSSLGVKVKDDPDLPRNGIILEAPPADPDIYKKLYEIVPADQKFQWVKYITYDDPLVQPVDGLIYQADDGWYLSHMSVSDNKSNTIDLLKNRKILLTKADNVFIIP